MKLRVKRIEEKKQIVRLRYGIIGEIRQPIMTLDSISRLMGMQIGRVG